MSGDLFGSPLVQQMRANILLAYAMNRVRVMSPAELQSCTRTPFGWPTLIWRDAVYLMRNASELKIGAWEGSGWRIPALIIAEHVRLPYDEAQRFMRGRRPVDPGPYPRTLIPQERAINFDVPEIHALADPHHHRPEGATAPAGAHAERGRGHDR